MASAPQLVIDESGQLDCSTFYDPFPHQREIHASEAHNLLTIGGAGSGKSATLLGEAIYTATEFAGSNCLLLRRDFPELERGLILDFKRTVPEDLYKYNQSKHIVEWWNGSLTFFGHLKDGNERSLAQYLSSAFVWIGIDEMGQFSFDAYSYLQVRNRTNKGCQPNALGDMPVPRMGGATNPIGPGFGWIKQIFVTKKPVSQMGDVRKARDGRYYQNVNGQETCVYDPYDFFFVHSTVLDNPVQLRLDPMYLTKLQRLPPDRRAKMLDGSLDSIEGSFFANFSRSRHVVTWPLDPEVIKIDPWQPHWLSFDYGLAHYSAIYWHCRAQMRGIDGKWKPIVLTYRELLVNEKGLREIVDLIDKRTPEEDLDKLKTTYLSPDRFARHSDPSKKHTVAAELTVLFREKGFPMCVPATDRRVDGAQFMYNSLDAGTWIMSENCPYLINSLETRVRDSDNLEDVLKVDNDELDDAYDSARYGLYSHLKAKNKPQSVKDQEHIDSIEDPTARMFAAYRAKLRAEERDKPLVPKIQPRWKIKNKPRH